MSRRNMITRDLNQRGIDTQGGSYRDPIDEEWGVCDGGGGTRSFDLQVLEMNISLRGCSFDNSASGGQLSTSVSRTGCGNNQGPRRGQRSCSLQFQEEANLERIMESQRGYKELCFIKTKNGKISSNKIAIVADFMEDQGESSEREWEDEEESIRFSLRNK